MDREQSEFSLSKLLPTDDVILAHAPHRLVWASNWPHPLPSRTAALDDAQVLDVRLDWAPDETTRNQVLAGNPAPLYGFR